MISGQRHKAIAFLRQNLFSSLLMLVFALAAVKLYSLYAQADVDDGHWQQFKIDHDCKMQAGEKGLQRLSWKCNDGQIYYSWRQQR
ncbi:MAG: hypothetical protein PHH59_02040 [Methylovulum sp.]|nr:hypothetical protein [Methylovulum sp.]MDD2722791.1 hypothetical protein [Methylovulum sp.]